MNTIDTIFFDLGDTLGSAVLTPDQRLERFDPFAFALPVLRGLAGERLGVISNTGDDAGARVNAVLAEVGLYQFFDPALLIYSKDLGKERVKDSPEVFAYAANLAGREASPAQCLFVGEDAAERGQALDAGWRVCPHPLLAREVLDGQEIRYLRVQVPPNRAGTPWREMLSALPFVPLHVDGPDGLIVYALASQRVAAQILNAQFHVTLLGDADTPLRTSLYLLRDDSARASGFMNTGGESERLFTRLASARTVLESGAGGILVALPPEVTLASIHFQHARHGHTLRLMPNPSLLRPAPPGAASLMAEADTPVLTADAATIWRRLAAEEILDRVLRFSGQAPLEAGGEKRIVSRHVLHDDNAIAVGALARELQQLAPDRLQVTLQRFSHQNRTLHNVVAELPGKSPGPLVLVTAHLDSIALPGEARTNPAPGADDDMSGVSAVFAIVVRFLQLASAFGTPERTVRFVLFNDEENGLVGSQACARQLRESSTQVAGVFQMDMIGYNQVDPRSWEVHVGYHPAPGVERRSLALAELIARVAGQVSAGLPSPQIYRTRAEEDDPAEFRSDHGPFQAQGYPACVVSEDFFVGPDADSPAPQPNPNYHQSGDSFVDAVYAADIARAVGAAAWATASVPGSPSGFASDPSPSTPTTAIPMPREIDTRKQSSSAFGPYLQRGSVRITSASAAAAASARSSALHAGIAAEAAPSPAPPRSLIDRALAFVQTQQQSFGLTATEKPEFVPDPIVQRTSSGAAAVHLQQYYRGVPVFSMARTVRFSAESALIDAVGENTAFPSSLTIEPMLSAGAAVRAAAEYLAGTGGETQKDEFGQSMPLPTIHAEGYTPEIIASFNLPSRPTVLTKGPFESPVPAHLVVFVHPSGPRLGWHVVTTFPDHEDQYVLVVSADAPAAEILYCVSTLHHAQARGLVYELNPGLKDRTEVPFPRPIVDFPDKLNTPLVGFPADWVEEFSTIGNSTRATLGVTTNTLTGQVQNGVVEFTPQDTMGDDQKLLNIFYFCNYMHDFLYMLGFDEAAGNFQRINFTHTGVANDPVQARAHSGPVRGTANMATFPDGTPPVMNMGLVAGGINRHTAFDADVVCHEYTHGLTNRLVGGPMNTQALEEPQSMGMGEGWSDYYALTLVSSLIGHDKTVAGDWVVSRPQGIRSAPYDDNYPKSYGDVAQMTDEHDIGEVWCATLMMLTRKVRVALNSDTDGYKLCWQIVTDGLKLTPANPSFIDARDAILLALQQLAAARKLPPAVTTLVQRAFWEAFAHFGMGSNASSDGATLAGITPDNTLRAVV
jgi:extracellular elastinolytic metalloproteinase